MVGILVSFLGPGLFAGANLLLVSGSNYVELHLSYENPRIFRPQTQLNAHMPQVETAKESNANTPCAPLNDQEL